METLSISALCLSPVWLARCHYLPAAEPQLLHLSCTPLSADSHSDAHLHCSGDSFFSKQSVKLLGRNISSQTGPLVVYTFTSVHWLSSQAVLPISFSFFPPSLSLFFPSFPINSAIRVALSTTYSTSSVYDTKVPTETCTRWASVNMCTALHWHNSYI